MTGSEHEHGQRPHHAIAVGHGQHRRRADYASARRRWKWQWNWRRRKGQSRGRGWYWIWRSVQYRALDILHRRFVRRLLIGAAATCVLATLVVLGLWWRLSRGPIELDVATPWLKAAIEENFGGDHSVVVGGTQIERDEKGRTSLRLRDIVVRDRDGTVVASAPKAEVGLSGRNLLFGRLIAQSLNLVGAEMAVRI